jgi:hypothetical protein
MAVFFSGPFRIVCQRGREKGENRRRIIFVLHIALLGPVHRMEFYTIMSILVVFSSLLVSDAGPPFQVKPLNDTKKTCGLFQDLAIATTRTPFDKLRTGFDTASTSPFDYAQDAVSAYSGC